MPVRRARRPQEAEVERRVVGDQDGAAGELEERRQHRADARGRGDHHSVMPVSTLMKGGIGTPGSTRVWNSPSTSPPRTFTAPISVIALSSGRPAGRLEVDDDERDLGQRRAELVERGLHRSAARASSCPWSPCATVGATTDTRDGAPRPMTRRAPGAAGWSPGGHGAAGGGRRRIVRGGGSRAPAPAGDLAAPAARPLVDLAASVLGDSTGACSRRRWRRVAAFAPARRARAGAAPADVRPGRDAVFRARGRGRWAVRHPELAAALDDGADTVPSAGTPARGRALMPSGALAGLTCSAARRTEAAARGRRRMAACRGRAWPGRRRSCRRGGSALERDARRCAGAGHGPAGAAAAAGGPGRPRAGAPSAAADADRGPCAARAAASSRARRSGRAPTPAVAGRAELARERDRGARRERAEQALRAGREGRSLADARVRLLLDTMVEAATGLRRELALPPRDLRPADLVAAAQPAGGSPGRLGRAAGRRSRRLAEAARAAAGPPRRGRLQRHQDRRRELPLGSAAGSSSPSPRSPHGRARRSRALRRRRRGRPSGARMRGLRAFLVAGTAPTTSCAAGAGRAGGAGRGGRHQRPGGRGRRARPRRRGPCPPPPSCGCSVAAESTTAALRSAPVGHAGGVGEVAAAGVMLLLVSTRGEPLSVAVDEWVVFSTFRARRG